MTPIQSPLTQAFLAHWLAVRGEKSMPRIADFMDRLEPRFVPYLMMLDIHEADLTVRFHGGALIERRGADQTGKSWLAVNPHLVRLNVMHDVWSVIKSACGLWTEARFTTTVQRALIVEALSLPLAAKDGRPPRIANLSVELGALDFEERAIGWHGKIRLEWIDTGRGVPGLPPLPVI
jgi:hypothetical protein